LHVRVFQQRSTAVFATCTTLNTHQQPGLLQELGHENRRRWIGSLGFR